MSLKYVGTSLPRKEAIEKVTGSAKFLEDLYIGPLLYAKIKKSNVAHAIIRSIDTSKAENYPGVKAVVTGKDFPNRIGLYLIDRNFFAVDKVRFYGEPVAAVAAVTEEAAAAAAELIEVEYEELSALFDPREAMKPDAPLIHEELCRYELVPVFYPKSCTNIANHFKLRKGDVEKGFAEADLVIERNYFVPHIQHVTLETHKAAAMWGLDGKLTIWTTAQSPSAVRQLLAKSLGMPLHKIRIISNYIGGGFGGKAGATMEGLVIPLAKKCPGYVVRLVFTREEDIQGSFVRQALYSRLKTGVRKDGRLTAMEYEMIWDGGAYTEYGVNIVRAAGYSSTGAYDIPNVKTDSYCVYTNNPVGGPLRGFGMCEMQWGIERQMDEIAGMLNIDPLQIRLINGMKDGSSTASGQVVKHVAFDQCLKVVADAVDFGHKGGKYRGKGIAGMVKAPAQPSNASSSAIIRLNEDGTVHLLIGSTEMGQGMLTVFVQMTAEALNIPPEKIELRMPDTDFTPYEWQSVGSRTTYCCGNAVLKAAQDVKDQLYALAGPAIGVPEDELELSDTVVRWVKDHSRFIEVAKLANSFKKATGEGLTGPIIGRGSWVPTTLSNLDPETGQGNPGLFWTFGATAAEVEIDPETGAINLLRIASVMDAGQAINPQLCKAQLNGGAIMGLGTALYEELKLDRGRVLNHNYTDYKIPTIENVPDINCFVLETPEEGGPFGARGVGEPPMIGVAPAIANAVANAIGVEFNTFPITPERIVQALKEKARKEGELIS